MQYILFQFNPPEWDAIARVARILVEEARAQRDGHLGALGMFADGGVFPHDPGVGPDGQGVGVLGLHVDVLQRVAEALQAPVTGQRVEEDLTVHDPSGGKKLGQKVEWGLSLYFCVSKECCSLILGSKWH